MRIINYQLSIIKKEAGFTIIELILTIAILSAGIIGAYAAFAPLITLTYNVSLKFTAVYLAQEGLEITRNIRDYNFINGRPWSEGMLACELGCQLDYKTGTPVPLDNPLQAYDPAAFLKVNDDSFYSYEEGENSRFQRKVTITQEGGPQTLKVSVLVSWEYASKPYSFESIEYLYDWN